MTVKVTPEPSPRVSSNCCGITYSAILAFINQCGGREAFGNMTTFEVWKKFIQSKESNLEKYLWCKPEAFVVHNWNDNFLQVIDGLSVHLQENQNTSIWFDIFCHNMTEFQSKSNLKEILGKYKKMVQINKVYLCVCDWKKPNVLQQALSLYELYCFAHYGECEIVITLPANQLNDMNAHIEAQGMSEVLLSFININIQFSLSSPFNERDEVLRILRGKSVAQNARHFEINQVIVDRLKRVLMTQIRRIYLGIDGNEKIIDRVLIDKKLALASVYNSNGMLEEAHCLYFECHNELLTLNVNGQDSVETLDILHTLGSLLEQMGRLAGAVRLMEICYKERCNLLGNTHNSTLSTMNKLACLYYKIGNFSATEKLYIECYELRKQALGDTALLTMKSLNNLVTFYRHQGIADKYSKYNKLMNQFKKSNNIEREKRNTHNPTTLYSMALYHESAGNIMHAEKLMRNCLQSRIEEFGCSHAETIKVMICLANMLYKRKAYLEAEPMFANCLELQIANCGLDNVETLKTMNTLACLYYQRGDFAKSEELHSQCFQLREKYMGVNHVDTMNSLSNLASCYYAQEIYISAEVLYQDCLKRRQSVLGNEHADSIATMLNLAHLYEDYSMIPNAMKLYQDVVEIHSRASTESSETLLAMNNLAAFYMKHNMIDLAEPLLQKCLSVSVDVYGEDALTTIRSISHLGSLYYNGNQYEQSEHCFKECLRRLKVLFGDDDSDTMSCLNNLAKVYQRLGKFSKSEPLFEECYNRRMRVLGMDHPVTISTGKSLDSVRQDIAKSRLSYRIRSKIVGIFAKQ